MNATSLLHRLTLAVALSLSAASLVAVAGEAGETTDIEVVSNGKREKISLTDLKIGETRQLYSEAGTLVTATRTAESLELDIAGDKTSIRMIDPAAGLDDAELAALIEAHAGEAGEGKVKRVIRVHADGEHAAHAAHHEAHRKVIVLSGKDGDLRALHGADEVELLQHLDADGDGKHVIVKRRVARPAGADAE